MSIEAKVEIHPAELAQIVDMVFSSMLGMSAAQSSAPWFAAPDRLTAAVHLAGEWNGAVLLECDHSQACIFAGRFVSQPAFDEVDDVVRDVLGELANMIAGNLKCVMTSGIKLSMPSVVDGSDYSLRVCRAEVRDRLTFACDEGPFWITILAMKERPEGRH